MNQKEWRALQAKLLKKKNVVAVGRGFKVTGGIKTDKEAVVCSVTRKETHANALDIKDFIPRSIQGWITDVVETGEIKALKARTERHRPAPGGVSIGHEWITAGTLGCLVKKDGVIYILSNNHVLADSNNAPIGGNILQPGKHDGGELIDTIAHLSEFVPIEFGGSVPPECPVGKIVGGIFNAPAKMTGRKTRLQAVKVQAADNYVDAAIALPNKPEDVIPEILEIGIPAGFKDAELGMKIQKSGRTTGYNTGEILQVDVAVNVGYGEGKTAMFVDQLIAGEMSAGGDSGSAVLDMDKNVVGLLFAGSDTTTVINRISHVVELLGLDDSL
jgi:hypothetical protein